MLARRHIRIKVLQALYAFYRDDTPEMVVAIKNLNRSLDRIYELYLYDICTLREILLAAESHMEIGRNKLRPTAEEVNPNQNFVNNRVLKLLANNVKLNKLVADRHITWSEYRDHFKKLLTKLRDDEAYQRYMLLQNPSFSDDKKMVKHIYANYVSENEFFHNIYEDLSIHWADDLDAAQMMTTKTIKTLKEGSDEYHPLVSLYKNPIGFEVIDKHKFDRISYLDLSRLLYDEIKNLYIGSLRIGLNGLTGLDKIGDFSFDQFLKEFGFELTFDKADPDEFFGTQLFRKVISNNGLYDKLISERTKNWESDRIAIIDNILMKMAIAEFTGFEEIPVKVTLNEYIELSKEYSTPKSATFINGVLDKLVADLREKNEIVKVGRGLL